MEKLKSIEKKLKEKSDKIDRANAVQLPSKSRDCSVKPQRPKRST